MKKYFIFAAFAGIALASCTDDDFVGNVSPPAEEEVLAPISFSSSQNTFTRADFEGAEAADKLGGKFVVTGFKGAKTNEPGNVVFDNYLVKYTENTANRTESNSANWEYVLPNVNTGNEYEYVPITHARNNGITSQTIKFWDYTKPQYDFFAWSAGKNTAIFSGTPGAGQVLVTNIQPNSKEGTTDWAAGSNPTRPAYKVTGSAEDLSNFYITDILTVNKTGTAAGTYGEVSGYNQTVKLKFRQVGTKVRIAIYETVPGYSVKDVQFYTAAAVKLADETTGTDAEKKAAALQNKTATLFTTTTGTIHTAGEATIYFPTVDTPADADNNQAHIKFTASGTSKENVDGGVLNYTFREEGERSTGAVYLGRTSNTASFAGDPSKDYYVFYLPNESGVNLNLRVNYTLESIDGSGETIKVQGATAQVPSIYTQWKPGFAYTYLFKISDETNGYTGIYDPTKPDVATTESGPEGLYPITFDAVVVNAEDGDNTQETITTVSAPSITTYQNGSNVVNKNEYTVLTPDATKKITGEIFVTVDDTESTATPDLANANLVTLAAIGDGTAKYVQLYTLVPGTTEAEVVDALQYQEVTPSAGVTVEGRNGVKLTAASGDNALALSSSVTYGVDGNEITLGATKAAKFKPAANTTYAFVYTKKAATATTDIFQPVTKAIDDPATPETNEAESVEGLFRYTLVAAATAEDVKEGVKYFENNDGSTGMITAFLGQTVNNLFTRSGSDPYVYTPASGYAKTNVDYYYAINGGKDYELATKVAYADFKTTNLWKDSSNSTAKTEETPVLGQAYYDTNGKYCVIYPQQTTGLYVFKGADYVTDNMTACTSSEKAVAGMVYFYKYTYNDAVRYAKIIKVQ